MHCSRQEEDKAKAIAEERVRKAEESVKQAQEAARRDEVCDRGHTVTPFPKPTYDRILTNLTMPQHKDLNIEMYNAPMSTKNRHQSKKPLQTDLRH